MRLKLAAMDSKSGVGANSVQTVDTVRQVRNRYRSCRASLRRNLTRMDIFRANRTAMRSLRNDKSPGTSCGERHEI